MADVVVTCPVDGVELHVQLTLEGDPPVFNLNAPEAVEHFKEHH
jgi:hypothetical protein